MYKIWRLGSAVPVIWLEPNSCVMGHDLTSYAPIRDSLLSVGCYLHLQPVHQICSRCDHQLRRCIRQYKILKLRWFNVLRSWGSPKVIGNIIIRYSAYDFLVQFNRNYEAISYRFRSIVAYFPEIKEVTWQWPGPFQGQFVVRRLGVAMINMYTNFEVSSLSHSRDILGELKI